tara:strand:- start:6321 stop:6971 length:651 start_codon:yes stop_codon:yes gene_type:complete
MSEENNNVEQQDAPEAKAPMFTEAQVQEMIAKTVQEEVNGLKGKNQELLGKLKAKDEALKEDQLKKEGTFEDMKAHWEDKYNSLKSEYEDKYSSLKGAVKERDKADIIGRLAGEFVDSEAGSFMLKAMIDVEDGNQTFRDFSGNVVADNLDDFKKWMSTNPHMAHFVRGTKATGGAASGGAGKASGEKTMARADFESPNFTPGQRMDFIKNGGQVI